MITIQLNRTGYNKLDKNTRFNFVPVQYGESTVFEADLNTKAFENFLLENSQLYRYNDYIYMVMDNEDVKVGVITE